MDHTHWTGKGRGRGRPALAPGAPSVSLHVRLSAAQYDATDAGARAARLPLAAYVRLQLLRAAEKEDTMTPIAWTLILLLLLALVFTLGSAMGKLPIWPAVLLVIVVQFLAGRPLP